MRFSDWSSDWCSADLLAAGSVLKASPGNAQMQEIAAAIQEGASAYLRRQYLTIAAVGAVIFVIVFFLLGLKVAIGFLVGSTLSGLAGLIGMHVSVDRKGVVVGKQVAVRVCLGS